MDSVNEQSPELTPRALALLFILRWEKARPATITVDEFVTRMGFSRRQVKDALTELYDHGYVEIPPAGEWPTSAES